MTDDISVLYVYKCALLKRRVYVLCYVSCLRIFLYVDPYRKLREPRGIKGIRQSVVITYNPSTIDQSQQLLVRYYLKVARDGTIYQNDRKCVYRSRHAPL